MDIECQQFAKVSMKINMKFNLYFSVTTYPSYPYFLIYLFPHFPFPRYYFKTDPSFWGQVVQATFKTQSQNSEMNWILIWIDWELRPERASSVMLCLYLV